MSNKILLVSNWKSYVEGVSAAQKLMSLQYPGSIRPIICPPYPFIGLCIANKKSDVALGAQNVDVVENVVTGTVSPAMLDSLGVEFCIVGHSERRRSGETDTDIEQKLTALVQYGITPILCVGEDIPENRVEILSKQLRVLEQLPENKADAGIVVAYEPVYAIGAPQPAENGDIQEAVAYIRKQALPRERISVLYGGSVDGTNAGSILETGADGFLLGRAGTSEEALNGVIQSICSNS